MLLTLIMMTGCSQETASPPPSPPIVMDPATGYSPKPPCAGKIPYDEPTTTSRISFDHFSFLSPFNSSWLERHDSFTQASAKGISFGTPRWTDSASMGERCDLIGDFSLHIIDPEEKITLPKLREQYGDIARVTQTTIQGHTILIVDQIDGVCPAPMIVMLFGKQSLKIQTSCEAVKFLKDPVNDLKTIARSVRIDAIDK